MPAYATNTKVNSAFHPSGVSKLSISLYGGDHSEARSPLSGGSCDLTWQVTLRSS